MVMGSLEWTNRLASDVERFHRQVQGRVIYQKSIKKLKKRDIELGFKKRTKEKHS